MQCREELKGTFAPCRQILCMRLREIRMRRMDIRERGKNHIITLQLTAKNRKIQILILCYHPLRSHQGSCIYETNFWVSFDILALRSTTTILEMKRRLQSKEKLTEKLCSDTDDRCDWKSSSCQSKACHVSCTDYGWFSKRKCRLCSTKSRCTMLVHVTS